MGWLLHITGVDDLTGRWYGFWSGFAGDLPMLAAIVMLGRRHNCHVSRCPRLGRFSVEGTAYRVCRRHAPPHQRRARRKDILREGFYAGLRDHDDD
jgi:hypothetical protein